jgi:thiamine pyrophosphokinase
MSSPALLFTGGCGPGKQFNRNMIPSCSYVCAADSGIETAIHLGYTVHEAIGDFDSLSSLDLLAHIPHIKLPEEKDVTDTEALLQHIKSKGFTSYILVGGGEGRFDHLIHLYSLFSIYGPPEQWITAREQMILVRDSKVLKTIPNNPLSIIPAAAQGKSLVSSRHLHWELTKFPISMEQQSISNKSYETTCEISVSGDPVFVLIPFPQ